MPVGSQRLSQPFTETTCPLLVGGFDDYNNLLRVTEFLAPLPIILVERGVLRHKVVPAGQKLHLRLRQQN